MPRAARRCGRRGCDERVPCPVHTPEPWEGSQRRAQLPSNWTALTRRVLREEPQCQLSYTGSWPTSRGRASCTVKSREVDHVDDPLDHSRSNLRGVCRECHRRRTQMQANGLPSA